MMQATDDIHILCQTLSCKDTLLKCIYRIRNYDVQISSYPHIQNSKLTCRLGSYARPTFLRNVMMTSQKRQKDSIRFER